VENEARRLVIERRASPDLRSADGLLMDTAARRPVPLCEDVPVKTSSSARRRQILNALVAANVGVEHIGSTSVPGLAAKPIIDIVVTVDDITAEEDYLDALLVAGYELRAREPGHRLVRTPARDVHVHIYSHGDPAVAEYLLLRDWLRSNAEDRALYESTKRSLLRSRWDDA
jgi:GrpB-like predicted nucleotidyltransferase (UPF0157 family)